MIKNALIYNATLPSRAALSDHLSSCLRQELSARQASGAGFIPTPITGELVTPIQGGYIICLRYDKKLLPSQVIRTEVEKLTKAITEEQQRKIGRKERQAITEEVLAKLLPVAFVQSRVITGYYHEADRRLIIDTSSKEHAAIMASKLVAAVGSVKTTTIHVSDVKQGLSTRLHAWLNEDDHAFDGFEIGAYCKMARTLERKETIAITGTTLGELRHDLTRCLIEGYKVESLLMNTDGVNFKLTADFALRSITFEGGGCLWGWGGGGEDAAGHYRQQAAVELHLLANVINKLCTLFDYKEADEKEQAAA